MLFFGDLEIFLATQGALFMKKIVLAIATTAAVTAAHAGSMGPVSMASYTPYLTGEASYTWPQSGSLILNNNSATSSTQGWGGRLGAGMMYGYSEKLSFTGEIGGGYYGSRNQSVQSATGRVGSFNYTLDGYDVLAGFVYKWNYFDVFFQAGFMMENMRTSMTSYLSEAVPGGLISGYMNANGNQTQTLPEIKVGGIYNINPNWGIDVAYMHVFGGSPSLVAQRSASLTTGFSENISANIQNPTLDSVMFGLHYNFVM